MSAQNSHSLLHLLRQRLLSARKHDESIKAHNSSGQIIQVPGTGKTISTAYEQLRNAAEYAEEHLLLQRAVKRFLKRNFSYFSRGASNNIKIGEELIVELTQAGYLLNGAFSSHTSQRIKYLADEYVHVYRALREARVARDDATDWVLAILSVEIENLLNPHSHFSAVAYSSYQHFLGLFPKDALVTTPGESDAYEISLYIAVHQALLKSDMATVRHDLVRMYRQSPHDTQAFIAFNENVTKLYTSRFTQRLKRAVSRHGAALRIVNSMAHDRPDMPELLESRERFMEVYNLQVNQEYRQLRQKLNKGIIKSIIFIFITKVIIGLGIEIPYDLIFIGSVAILPLAINLLFPPLYMASLKLGLKVPSIANARVLSTYIDKALFTDEQPLVPSLRDSTRTASTSLKALYALLFFVPFAIMVYALSLLHFNWVQMLIFVVFLSTASFLGFRLSTMVRDLEIISHQTNFLSTVRDFFYLPFILLGQWLSSKYARVNAVPQFLDVAIELPLKSILRLFRQWTRFINEKHDEIY